MIMPNLTKEEPDKYKKIFTNILHEAHRHWDEFRYDEANKKASGLIVTADGKVFTAELSYNDIKNSLTLTVRLQVEREPGTSFLRQISRFQTQHRDLSSFLTHDDECGTASIVANVPVYDKEPSLAVDCVFTDTCRLLEDVDELLN